MANGIVGRGFAAVDCVAMDTCIAVGEQVDTSDDLTTLIEEWNGARWAVVSSPSPGLNRNELLDVSCARLATCVAVGAMDTARSIDTMILSNR